MKQKIGSVALFMAFAFFMSCGDSAEKNSDAEQAGKKAAHKDCKDVHWSHHEGDDGPANWKNLCDGFADCGGRAQSPINIITKDVVAGKDLSMPELSYGESKVNIVNNSHTVQFNVTGEHKVNLNGKSYKLLQFHYHALSEHTIDGKQFPIEVHFVHQHSETDFAVLGAMFVEGGSSALFESYLDKFPTSKGDFNADETINLQSLLPENKSYYHYNGSLTTPPCSEVVNWYVLKNPVEASKEQIEKFSKILNNNFRPIMPLDGRKILSSN